MKLTRNKLLISSIMTSVLALSSTQALAQDSNSDDEIIVTGSRISNPNLVQSSQIQVIDSQEADLRNVVSVESLIRDLPGVVAGIGTAVNNGNGGAQTVNLRGIGANRNLVLLDGRRIVPFGLGGVTDTNNIPLGLIERTDIVTGGATTVYGADAVSGVLNFVTKQDFEGAELTTSYGITEAGDGGTFRAEILTGANFDNDRGNVVFSLGYQDSNPVLQGDRDFSETFLLSSNGNEFGSINSAPFVLSTGTGANAISDFQFNPSSGLLEDDVTPFNFNPLNLLQTPVERFNVYGAANYELTDNIEAYAQGFFVNTFVGTTLAPSAAFGITVQLPLSNPFLTDGVRDQICLANSISTADCLAADAVTDENAPGFVEVPVSLRRRFVEAGARRNEFVSDVFQFSGGFRGNIFGSWNYDISGQYGESSQRVTATGFGLFSRLQQGIRAVDENTCTDTSNGCVPLNLFGDVGTLSQEGLAFLDAASTTTTNVSQGVIQANFSGDLGGIKSPFADEVIGVAFGGEYRDISANSAGDFLAQQPGELLGSGGADPAISGSFDVVEGYIEAIAPLAQDLPFVKSLNLELGARLSDYSTSGTSLTWKVGGNWDPIEGYRLRTVFQRAARSPNVAELFSPTQSALNNLQDDPCAGDDVVAGSALAALCISQGAPAGQIGFISQPAAAQVSTIVSGNPTLGVETASTFTVGLIAQPPQVENLTLTLDYFQIRIADAISAPGVDDLVSLCFDEENNPNLDFNDDCQLITRNSLTGTLNLDPSVFGGFNLTTSNAGTVFTNGLDFSVAYNWEAGAYGGFDYRLNGTYTFSNEEQPTPASVNRECVGFFSTSCGSVQPEAQITQRLTWDYDRYNVSVRHRYLSGTEIEPLALETSTVLGEFQRIDAEHYFDLTLVADVTDWAEFSLTVNNVTDNQPPIVGGTVGSTAFNTGNTFPSTFDALGRAYTAGLRLRF